MLMTAVASAAAALGSGPAMAATIYWDGGANQTWSNSTNWSSLGTAGDNTNTQALASGDDVVFARAGGINRNTLLGANATINGLTFNGSSFNTTIGGTTAGGQTLTIGAGGITVSQNGAGTTYFGSTLTGITLSASQSWSNTSGSSNQIIVAATLNLGTGNTLTITNNNANTTTLSNTAGATQLYGSITGSSSAITVNSGLLIIGGANTSSNTAYTINNGGAILANSTGAYDNASSRVGTNATLSIGSGTFQISYGTSAVSTSFNSTTLTGGHADITNRQALTTASTLNLGTVTRTSGVGATLNISLDPSLTVSASGLTNTNGIIGPWLTTSNSDWAAETGGNIVAYSGYVTTAGANPAWAATDNVSLAGTAATGITTKTINSLRLTAGATHTLANGNTLTITTGGIMATASGANLNTATTSGGILRPGVGADWVISVASGGSLVISNANAIAMLNPTSGTSSLIKTGLGTLTLSSTNNAFGGVGNSVFINAGTLSFSNSLQLGNTNNNVVLNGGTLAYSATGSTTVNRAIVVNVASTIAQAQTTGATETVYSGPITGSGSLTFTASADNKYIVLSNTSNSFGGVNQTLTLGGSNATILTASSVSALGSTSNTIVLSGMGLGIRSGGSVTLAQNIRGSGNIVADSGTSTTLTLSGAITSTGTFIFNTSSNNNQNQANTALGGANSVVVLDGDLSGYTNGIQVNNGVVRFGPNAIMPTSFGTLSTSGTGSTFDLNNRSATFTGITTPGTAGIVTNSGTSNATFTITTGASSYSGVISGNLNILKTGANTQTFSSPGTAKNYTGTTIVQGSGGLTITGAVTATSSVAVRGGATLTLSNSSGALVDSAGITLGGTSFGGGTLAVTASETVGQLTLNGGSNVINTSASQNTTIGSLNGTRGAGSTINFTNTGTNTFTTAPTLTNGLIGGWATYNGNTFASLNGSNQVIANTTNEVLVSANLDPNGANWISTNNIVFDTVATTNLTSSITVNSVRTTLGNNSTLLTIASGGTLNIATGGLIGGGTTNVRTIAGTAGVITSGTGELNISSASFSIAPRINLSGGSITITNATVGLSHTSNDIGDIYLNGSGTLNSNANGVLGSNSTSNTIHFYGGTLALNANQSIGKSMNVGLAGGTLNFVGTTNSAIGTISSNIALNGNLTIARGRGIALLSGTISGDGGLFLSFTSNDSGPTGNVIEITGNNTFTGGVSVGHSGSSAGNEILRIGSDTALGTGTFTIGVTQTKGIQIDTSGGSRTLANALVLSNTNSQSVEFINSNPLTFTGPVSIATNQAGLVNVSGAGLVTWSGPVSGTQALVKASTGTLQLSGPSTLTGGVQVDAGTLLIGGNAPSGNPGSLGMATSAIDIGRIRLENAVAATTANITLSAPQTIDGISVVAGDRVLVKNQTASAENGLYVVQAGAWVRAADFNANSEFKYGLTVQVTSGTQAGTYAVTIPGGTIGSTNPSWTSSSPSTTVNLLTSAEITVDRDISANYMGAGGTTTIGGNHTSGTSIYTGAITLGNTTDNPNSNFGRSVSLSAASGGTVVFSGIIRDPASLTGAAGLVTKSGLGTVNLTAANTYAGGTTVNAGTLLVNNTTGSGTGTGTVNVNTGTLGGVGIISGAVTVASGGTLAPGNSIGTLTINNALVLSGTSDFEINASTMTNDSVSGITSLTYGGTLKITKLAGTFSAGQSWDLFNGSFASPTGTWANAAFIGTNGTSDADIPDLGAGMIWNFNYATGVLSIDALTTRYASITSSAAEARRDDSPDTSTNDDAQGTGTQRVFTGIEVDGLNTDANTAVKGSVLIAPGPTSPGRTYVAMWLTGTAGAIDSLIAELDDDTAYLIRDIDSGETGGLTLAEWNYVQTAYAGNPQGAFNVLLAFDNITNPFFNWNFTGAGVGVDAVAVIPEPTSLALLGLGAVGLLARRRSARRN